jgi:hypothetical protein
MYRVMKRKITQNLNLVTQVLFRPGNGGARPVTKVEYVSTGDDYRNLNV